ncbi:MAG TPA: hypothetical protein VMV10_26820 [Pirellulales bacterium]|nr:hypothetical protein [Pirellulales bacterium]
MAIQFVCPYGHRLKVPEHRAGKKGRCPKCYQRVIVPVPNPLPSGKEKKPWNATTGDGILSDDQDTPGFSDDDILDNPFLENLLEKIGAPRLAADNPPEHEQPPEPIEAELELPPEILTFAAEAAPPTEPPLPLTPPSPDLVFARTEPESPAVGAFEDLPEIVIGAASQTPPLAPPPLEQPPSEVSIVHAPPPVTAPPVTAPAPNPSAANSSLATTTSQAASSVAVPRWVARARAELAERSYRPNPQQLENVYWLALVLLFVIVFTSAPALGFLRLDEAPRWAQAMLLVAGLQAAYAAWLAIVPDWSTVRVGMWLFAASAFAYAAASGMYGMAGGGELPLELTGSRTSAAGWCGANSLVLGLMSYACGQVCANWRRADFIAYSASRRAV